MNYGLLYKIYYEVLRDNEEDMLSFMGFLIFFIVFID